MIFKQSQIQVLFLESTRRNSISSKAKIRKVFGFFFIQSRIKRFFISGRICFETLFNTLWSSKDSDYTVHKLIQNQIKLRAYRIHFWD